MDWFGQLLAADDIQLGFGWLHAAAAWAIQNWIVANFATYLIVYYAVAMVRSIWLGASPLLIPISRHWWRGK